MKALIYKYIVSNKFGLLFTILLFPILVIFANPYLIIYSLFIVQIDNDHYIDVLGFSREELFFAPIIFNALRFVISILFFVLIYNLTMLIPDITRFRNNIYEMLPILFCFIVFFMTQTLTRVPKYHDKYQYGFLAVVVILATFFVYKVFDTFNYPLEMFTYSLCIVSLAYILLLANEWISLRRFKDVEY